MFVLLKCTFLCMYLPQAVSLPPSLGIESDLFQRSKLVQENELEPAVST